MRIERDYARIAAGRILLEGKAYNESNMGNNREEPRRS